MSRCKHLAAATTAALILGALVGTASAAHLSSSTSNFRIVWTSLELESGVTVRCPVTIEGSIHSRTFVKTANALIGYITKAIFSEASCVGGKARALTENFPWHIPYSSFSGNLPTIAKVRFNLIGMRLLVLATFPIIGEVSCLYTSETGHPATLELNRETGGGITSTTAGGRINGTGVCPEGSLRGSGATTTLGTSLVASITLI
jgi:hypothetical protein